jgi:hypothetical protein
MLKRPKHISERDWKFAVVSLAFLLIFAPYVFYTIFNCLNSVPNYTELNCDGIQEILINKVPTSYRTPSGMCGWDRSGSFINLNLNEYFTFHCLIFCGNDTACWNETIR